MKTSDLPDRKYSFKEAGISSRVHILDYADIRRYFARTADMRIPVHAYLDETGLSVSITTCRALEIHLAHGNTVTANGREIRLIEE